MHRRLTSSSPVFVLALALAAWSTAGCSAKKASASDGGTGMTEEQAQAAREACTFQAGALPQDTLAGDAPRGTQIPIDHIIVIVQENRSFDYYFSKLSHDNVDVASPTATDPDPDGGTLQRYHATEYCISSDVNHDWDGVRTEFDNGKMDGFAIANASPDDPSGHRALGYLDETDVPFYYDLARTFAISDRHFCSAPGDTAPNREFVAAASSRGAVDESVLNLPQTDAAGNNLDNIYSRIDSAGIKWKFYSAGGTPQQGSFFATNLDFSQRFIDGQGFNTLDDFYADAKAGTLPSVSFVDEATTDTKTCLSNEHPTKDPQLGQKFIANVVNALLDSPDWNSSALFVTWDEHGGFYDHVYPPPACKPDDFPPVRYVNGTLTPAQGAFDIYGPRVPLLVVSPYVKRGHVSHHVSDHTSILRFIEARFNLPALTRRDANADPLYDMFDFQHPDFSKPTLKPAVIDDPTMHSCGALAPSCTF